MGMNGFEFSESEFQVWANAVNNFLTGDTDSYKEVSKRIDAQATELAAANIWSGAAAEKNYQDIVNVNNALIKFVNIFSESYTESMNNVKKAVSTLEGYNMGKTVDTSSYGTITAGSLADIAAKSVNKNETNYDYNQIQQIADNFQKQTLVFFETVTEKLNKKIDELNSGKPLMNGVLAENLKQKLLETIKQNIAPVKESFEICIKNIRTSGENAEALDNTAV